MLIRSQNKRTLININNVTSVSIISSGIVNAYYNHSVDGDYAYDKIGEYSTEEKAIKVLDMISEKYLICPYAEENRIPHSAPFPKVFQMPQESEVE